jgi:phosphatidylglycerophosphate synthase
MLSRWIRTWYGRPLTPFLLLLASFGITPAMLTIGSLLLMVVSGFAFSHNHLVLGGVFLLLGGLLDGLDGELARVSNHATPFGAFLDSICDHLGDCALSLGLLWLYLGKRASIEIMLIVVVLFGSVLGSLVRSRAAMIGIETKDVGLVTRFERILLLLLGVFTGWITIALWLLAGLNNLAAFQRILYVVRVSHLQKHGSMIE